MRRTSAILLGAMIMTQAAILNPAAAASPDPAVDSRIDPKIRSFLAELNKDSTPFWEKPGPQVRATLSGLQAQTPVDVSGVTISEKTIAGNGQSVKLYVVKPEKAAGTLPALLF